MSVSGCASSQHDDATPTATVELATVIAQLEPALSELDQIASEGNLTLDSVTLSFQTVSTRKQGGTIGLLLFSIGGESVEAETSTFTVKLTKIVPRSQPTSAAVDRFFDTLKDLVTGTATQMAGLETAEVTGTIKFVVAKNENIKAGYLIEPISTSIGAKATKSHTHFVTVVLRLR